MEQLLEVVEFTPAYKEKRGCLSKIQYRTRAEARNQIKRLGGNMKGINCYHCNWCNGWHIGHKRRKQDIKRYKQNKKGGCYGNCNG